MGFLGEFLSRIGEWQARRDASEPVVDQSPADGVVEIVPVAATRSDPNPVDSRFRRFETIEQLKQPLSRVRRRASGKTPTLLGRVAFVSVFLGRGQRGWTDAEIATTQAALLRVGEWLEREAMRLGAAVNIELAEIYFRGTDPAPDEPIELAIVSEEHGDGLMNAHAEVAIVASASRIASDLGFHDIGELASHIATRLTADAIVWFLHPRSRGRSFVVPEKETGMEGFSLAVCYAQEDDLPGPIQGSPFADPSTFAHEALHLFGASDKYGVPLSRFEKGSVTRQDVMRLDYENLSRLRIDPATATEIGWA